MASSQHRRVFVGNIPYDATEEQLVQICEDVGPVVSFRLVVDRETGKPKGYGFCEYKDEETALSARRNLQGYEINGRQLRVDFAENDKGSDRNREQGRGGPGVAPNAADVNKQQVGGPAGSMDATLNQQVGVSLAMTAASVMAGALGGAQATVSSISNGPSQQPLLGNDPLTIHLAKMSKGQLIQVISEMKVLATQNYDLARQLLDACPQLPKALFQAQIMLGMVTPPMLQMPNIRQASAQASTQFPTQVRGQAQNHAHIGGAQENLIAAPSVVNALPPARPQQLGGMSSGPPMMAAMPMRPVQAPLLHNSRLSGPGSSGHGIQPAVPGGSMLLGGGSQAGSLVRPATSDTNRSAATAVGDGPWAGRIYPNSTTSLASADENGSLEQFGRPSKLVKLEDGRGATLSGGHFPLSAASNPKLTNAAGISVIKEPQNLETQAPQLQVPPELESALLQQLKNLTPEQLSTLSPEQQQQVIQLQKMLR